MNFLLMACGGAVGSFLRGLFYYFFNLLEIQSFTATLCVNIIGSFLFGLLFGLNLKEDLFFNSFIFMGILGGFTTFSTFSFDIFLLLQKGQLNLALFYSFGSLLFCISAVFIGYLMAR